MSKKMLHAPVYYALAQARFNPILRMNKYVGEIQDLLREKGYVNFEPIEVNHLHIPNLNEHVITPQSFIPMVNWLFTDSDRRSGFILNNSTITHHTTKYQTNLEFLPELLIGLEVVHSVVNLAQINRLGIRYLDAVLPKKDESIDQYLVPGLQGITFKTAPQFALNEYVFRTECEPLIANGTLIARLHRFNGLLGYPPDITPHGLVQAPQFQLSEPLVHSVIDTDHFVEGVMPIDIGKLQQQLNAMHGDIKSVFNSMITEHAQAVWS